MSKRPRYQITRPESPGSSVSAADVMPTHQAAIRAARFPVAGDIWQEMCSVWWHVDNVTDVEVVVRRYVGPCQVVPDEAKETKVIGRFEFEDWILNKSGADYDGNYQWAAQVGGFYTETLFGKRSAHWKTTKP